MPYGSLSELPDSVRSSLPKSAQEIYKKAFNSAWKEYSDPKKRRGRSSREETAHRVAWSAVKEKYQKSGDGWKRKS